jgi:hypothetical protein
MNTSSLLAYVGFPAIFLIVATANPRNLVMKCVCIVLAYFSLILLDGGANAGNILGMATEESIGKDSSPFGLVFLAISVWGFVLVGSSINKKHEEDKSR